MTSVYVPSDDTFLLVDSIKKFSVGSALEIGVGSGLATVELARRNGYVVGTDLNESAIRDTRTRLDGHGLNNKVELIGCAFAEPLRAAYFDLVVFNPPYVPSEDIRDEAVDGGAKGVKVALGMLGEAMRVVKSEGSIVFVASSIGSYSSLLEHLRDHGFEARLLTSKRLFFEEIMVFETKKA